MIISKWFDDNKEKIKYILNNFDKTESKDVYEILNHLYCEMMRINSQNKMIKDQISSLCKKI